MKLNAKDAQVKRGITAARKAAERLQKKIESLADEANFQEISQQMAYVKEAASTLVDKLERAEEVAVIPDPNE